MAAKVVASGSLVAPPRVWEQSLVFELRCTTKTTAPKGLPSPSDATLSVFCSPKAWRKVQDNALAGHTLHVEGEFCFSAPPNIVQGNLPLVALAIATFPPKDASQPESPITQEPETPSTSPQSATPPAPVTPAPKPTAVPPAVAAPTVASHPQSNTPPLAKPLIVRIPPSISIPSPPRPPNPLNPPPQVQEGMIPPDAARAVWDAEDGRCEACGRPSVFACSFFSRINDERLDFSADNLHLLCADCKQRLPDPLQQTHVFAPLVAALQPRIDPALDAAAWIVDSLRRCGAVVHLHPSFRMYHLGGVAVFILRNPYRQPCLTASARPLKPGLPTLHLQAHLPPQARTRGLPKPVRVPSGDPSIPHQNNHAAPAAPPS